MPLNGYDTSLLQSNHQSHTAKLARLADEPIAVAAVQVDPAAKTEVVETVQARLAKVVEPDLPPLARTA